VSLPTFTDGVVDAGGGTDNIFESGGMCCSKGFGSIRSHCSKIKSFLTNTFFFFHRVVCPSDLTNPDNDKCKQVAA
jgi:hypothetical protein